MKKEKPHGFCKGHATDRFKGISVWKALIVMKN